MNQMTRKELKERIQTLEWSLAQKNRENKILTSEALDRKQEVANLTAENNDLRGISDSTWNDESQSG